jgi:hypothetical protein
MSRLYASTELRTDEVDNILKTGLRSERKNAGYRRAARTPAKPKPKEDAPELKEINTTPKTPVVCKRWTPPEPKVLNDMARTREARAVIRRRFRLNLALLVLVLCFTNINYYW